MHDSEQEHSGITGCRVTYESTIFYNEANKFSIIVVKTNDPRIPLQACNGRYYGDRMLRFTAVGYELPRTKAVELELDGEWVESKYGYQLQVEQWQEIVPQTADGLLAYLGSGLIKGIGPKTAEDIVATFGPDTLNILDNEPEKLLQIRGITEGKLKDIEESYAESRVLRNLMSLLGPFKITPATALKIYQNFGPACVDILKKCPYDLCQISGFGFKRVDGIVRKTDNRLHSAERTKGAVLYTLEDARSKSGHLFLPSEDLVKETLLLLNAPIPIPEQRVRAEEVQETLQQMILHGAVVAYKQYLYSPRVFGQEDDTARMIAERLANISVAENIESALESSIIDFLKFHISSFQTLIIYINILLLHTFTNSVYYFCDNKVLINKCTPFINSYASPVTGNICIYLQSVRTDSCIHITCLNIYILHNPANYIIFYLKTFCCTLM